MRSFIDLLRPHARPRLGSILLAMLLGMVSAAFLVGALGLIEVVWEDVLFEGSDQSEPTDSVMRELVRGVAGWFAGDFEAGSDRWKWALLGVVCGSATLLGLLGAATHYAYTWLSRRIALDMVIELRMRLARHLMGLSLRYHGERQFGDLLSRISTDVERTLGAINVAFKAVLQEGILALVTIGFLVHLLWGPESKPLLIVLLAAPIIILPVSSLSKKIRRRARQAQSTLGASVQVLSQMFLGVRTVKSFGGEERELAHYQSINDEYHRTTMRVVRAQALTQSWTAFFSLAGFAILIGIMGAVLIRSGGNDLTGGEMTMFFLFVARASNHVKNVTRGWTQVNEAMGAATRIQGLLDEPVEVAEVADPKSVAGLATAVRFENVTFSYPDTSEPALVDFTLELRAGETLALVGESGAGKSTVMDLVARFFDVTEGRVTVDGVELRELRLREWTAQYAMVGQSPFLFHASIGENIAYGKPGASQAEIEAAARAADIHTFIESLPEGYATDVAEMGSRLSGGQRQRITIARALLKGAPILLLDEATSALDSKTEVQVQAALDRLMAERTVLVIAHRLSTIKNADRIAVMDRGRLVELGSHDELLERGGAYAKLVALQKLEKEPVS